MPLAAIHSFPRSFTPRRAYRAALARHIARKAYLAPARHIARKAYLASAGHIAREALISHKSSETPLFTLDSSAPLCYNLFVDVPTERGVVLMKNERMIRLSTISDVREFVEIVTASARHEIDLASGRYVVDGKSIMGIFSLDLSNPIKMTVHGDHAEELLEKLQKFVVEG